MIELLSTTGLGSCIVVILGAAAIIAACLERRNP